MMARTEWAAEAAEHMLPAVRIVNGAIGIEADQARDRIPWAYRDLLFYIGTIPGDRTEQVYDATVHGGATVAQALDAIGA